MIIIDTNVLSEIMRPDPELQVLHWMDSITIGELGITSVTVSEILYWIGLLPAGKRKTKLIQLSQLMFEEDFAGRIFSFDQLAAVDYAAIIIEREKKGNPISMSDAQIAAICRSRDFSLATRSIKDFTNTGIRLINPWDE